MAVTAEAVGRKAKGTFKATLAAGALILAGPTVLHGCGEAVGSKGHKISAEEATEKALKRYDEAFHRASPAGKFVLQYIQTTEVTQTKYEGNHGLIAAFHEGADGHMGNDYVYAVKINNACLQNTAYDIAGGTVKGPLNGLFSSGGVDGRVPTAAAYAEVNPDNPDELIVQSGHDNSKDLHFSGLTEGNALVSADDQTKNALATYGCETGVMKVTSPNTIYDQSSPYIR